MAGVLRFGVNRRVAGFIPEADPGATSRVGKKPAFPKDQLTLEVEYLPSWCVGSLRVALEKYL
jgi:hypothetical protein